VGHRAICAWRSLDFSLRCGDVTQSSVLLIDVAANAEAAD